MGNRQGNYVMRIIPIRPFVYCSIACLFWGCGYDKSTSNRIEIIQGLEWQWVEPTKSCIIWKQNGFKVEGDLTVTFCDDGLNIDIGRGNVVYLDIVKGEVCRSHGSFVPRKRSKFREGVVFAYSANGVIGPKAHDLRQRFSEE